MDFSGRSLSLLLLVLVAGAAAAADQVFVVSGAPFGRSSLEPGYRVEFYPVDYPFHPESGQENVPMTSHDGKEYSCFLPIEETKPMKSPTPENSTSLIIEGERRITSKGPDELLEVLKDQCIYMHEGWWTYELCYQGKIRQVHLEGNNVIQEYFLGIFDPEATAKHNGNRSDESIESRHLRDISQRFHTHIYTNGTVCDLTDISRETEVRFVCSGPDVLINSIKEISSCKYVVTVQSPMLCKNPFFKQEKHTFSIHCNELPAGAGAAHSPNSMEDDESTQKKAHISIIPESEAQYSFPT